MSRETLEIRMLRSMAWERAKGELRSMLHTYIDNKENYEAFDGKLEDFIKDVESSGVAE